MRAKPLVERVRHSPPLLVDGVLAVTLLAIDLGGWATTPQPRGGIRDWDALALCVLAVGSLPVAWRRGHPVAVLALVFSALTFHEALGFPDAPILGPYFALYSVGAYCELRRSAAASALAVGVYLAGFSWGIVRHDVPPFAIVRSAFLVAVAWGLGVSVRHIRLYAAELEHRAAYLQSHQDEEARRAVADERARIARELHDVVAHNVSVMVVQASGARRVLDVDPERAGGALESIETTGRQALAEMRRLLGFLRRDDDGRASLEPQPGVAQLDALLSQVNDAGLPVELAVEGEPRALPAGVDLSAYRIIQEALTNTLKHAGPARARVRLSYADRELTLEVADDGQGRSTGEPAHGQGLMGMRERAALVGGDLEAGPGPQGGYQVRARLPIDGSAS